MSITPRAYIRENWFKLAFFLLTLVFLLAVIVLVDNMLVSFLLAFVTYYLLSPMVNWMERRGLSRFFATTIPFVIFSVFMTAMIVVFAPDLLLQIKLLQQNFAVYYQSATSALHQSEQALGAMFRDVYPIDIVGKLQPKILEWAAVQFRHLPELLSKSLTVMFLAPFLAYFMLLDGRESVRKILSLAPNNLFELVLNLNYQIASRMGGFIRARLLESIIVGLVIWIGLSVLGFPYALLLASTAAVLNNIPYVGPVIAFAPALIIGFANHESSSQLLAVGLVYLIAQAIDGGLLVPFLVARIVNLHPVTVVIVLIIGANFLGILGMIISIPVASALKVIAIAVYRHITGSLT